MKTVSIPDNGNLRNSVPVKFENLPDSVTLHFPGEDCGVADQRSYNLVEMATGKVHRPEFYNSLHVTVRSHIPGCQQGQTKLHSDLLEKGLPQRPTALVIREMGAADFITVDSITLPISSRIGPPRIPLPVCANSSIITTDDAWQKPW